MGPAGPARAERRLAAILAADVGGYSRLIEADEEGTLDRLRTLGAEVIHPKIAAHRGRIVKTTGDGLLVEFASVVDALRCAAEIQRALAKSNAPLPTDRRIEFRIGINTGDIVVEDGDIFGDGVNVGARLEGLAEPGGICVSARVQEEIGGRLDLAFRDLDRNAAHRADGKRYEVGTVSLTELLDEHRAPRRIDFLSIDTEGSELEILQGFDFTRYDVRIIVVEHNHTARREAIHGLLTGNGFRRKFETCSKQDDWYVRAG
jgi:class 3 adenylate cyclase